MKEILIDLVGLVGLCLLAFGLYGIDPRLAAGVVGVILMAYAWFASKNSQANSPDE